MKNTHNTKQTKASSKASRSEVLANELLELHLEHEMAAFEGEAFVKFLREEMAILFESIKPLTLQQFVDAEQVKQVIARNVVENDIPGAIIEIAGDAASQLFSSEMHKSTSLNKIFSAKQYEEFVDKILELPEQRKKGINHLIELPIYGDLISGVLYQAILRYIYDENIVSKHIPGVASVLKFGKRMIDKTAPSLEGAVEDNVRAYIAANLAFMLRESKAFLENSLTEAEIKASAMELWDTLESKTMGDFQQGMDAIDLSEFIVLGYEFWKQFRKTKYFKDCYELIVDYVFEVYGQTTLGVVLEDMMITPDRLMQEAELFAPKVLAALKENGLIEAFLRRKLEGFYSSQAALDCLNKNR